MLPFLSLQVPSSSKTSWPTMTLLVLLPDEFYVEFSKCLYFTHERVKLKFSCNVTVACQYGTMLSWHVIGCCYGMCELWPIEATSHIWPPTMDAINILLLLLAAIGVCEPCGVGESVTSCGRGGAMGRREPAESFLSSRIALEWFGTSETGVSHLRCSGWAKFDSVQITPNLN